MGRGREKQRKRAGEGGRREARRKRENSRDRKQERNRKKQKIHPKTKLEPHMERNRDRDRETHRHPHSGWWEVAGNGVYCLFQASPFPFSLQTGRRRPGKGIRLAPVDTVCRHYDRI